MLDCLVLCMARDGSTTLREILREFCRINDHSADGKRLRSGMQRRRPGCDLGYVTDSYSLWPRLRSYIETADSDPLLSILSTWRQRLEVSQGLGFALPVVRAAFGPDLRIVRVTRERRAHIRSLVNQSFIDPEHWDGYADGPHSVDRDGARTARPTAVDFGEMTAEEWNASSRWQRFEWFVDKQTHLIDTGLRLFSNVLIVRVEELSDVGILAELGRFVEPGWSKVPDPVHIHRVGQTQTGALTEEQRKHLEEVWQQFDLGAAYRDPKYALEFVLADLQERFLGDPDGLRRLVDPMSSMLAESQMDGSPGRAPDINGLKK